MSASWVTRTPAIRDDVRASTAEMGVLLFGISVGAMIGVLGARSLIVRFGARPVIATGVSLGTTGMFGLAVGSSAGSGAIVCVGFFLFGLGMGLGDIAVNIGAAAIEATSGTHVLPLLHGSFSLGTVVGAAAGIGASAVALPIGIHLTVAAVLAWCPMIATLRWVPREAEPAGRQDHSSPTARMPVWRDRTLLALGFIILAMAMSEGAANDWLPLIFVDGYHLDQAIGSVLYTIFAAAMTIGRFTGGPLLTRFGHTTVIRTTVLTAIAGVALVVFAPNPVFCIVAVVLWGLGASLGFPVVISAAGRHPHDAAARVALVSAAGYFSFLVGPPSLGFAGQHFGLRKAMLLLVVLLCTALVCTIQRRSAHAPTDSTPADRDSGCHTGSH